MELNTQKFALAAALTAGVAYVVCALVVFIAPELAMKLLGWVAHIVNVDKFAGDVEITAAGLAAGLAEILIYAYAFAWLLAQFYNKLIGR